MICCCPVPLLRMIHTSIRSGQGGFVDVRVKAIHFPSGDQTGSESRVVPLLRFWTFEPSAFMTKMFALLLALRDIKAIRSPSGDHEPE